jgi:hypothetical protein
VTEIPEHLLKRAAERKAALQKQQGDGGDAPAAAAAEGAGGGDQPPAPPADPGVNVPGDPAGRIPEQLLTRPGGAAPAAAAVATAPPPVSTGPEGHTQRLLTVVKAGSIQDVKATPGDKVNVWPHLLVIEFVAALAMTAFLLVFSALVNAPLQHNANYNFTPNPSKAPWYFLGLQELLTMFHPMVAGVTIPGIGIFALILAPYTDRNPSNKPEDRKFAISIFAVFLMFWAVLVVIGVFFRGPGFNFTFPWRDGIFFDL